MILNLGDVAASATVYVPFHTFDSNDPSASVTITGLAVTDIEIYKDGGTTQRSSDAGYSLLDTDGIDFDGITGLHGLSIDLSDDTDSGFYAAGSTYWVAVSSITVDGATINFWAAVFTIDRTGGTATVITDTEAVLTDSEAVITDTEAVLADTEAATAVLTDTEAILTDSEAVLADTEAATAVITDTEAILSDTEGAITERSTILTDTEAILSDTEGLSAGSGLTPLASGTAQGGTSTTIQLASAETFADNELNGNIVKLTGGTGAGQSRLILSYTGSSDTATVSPAWTTNPSSDSTYEVVEGAANLVAVGLTAQTAGDVISDTEAVLADTEAAVTDTEAIISDTEGAITERSTLLTDTEAILTDTEAATGVITDTEAILSDTEGAITERTTLLTDTEAVLTDTEAATAVLTDTEAILTDTEAAVTERTTLLTDTEAVLADTEAATGVITDTEAILADTGTDGVKLNATQPTGWAANLAASAGQIIKATVDTATNSHTPTTTEFQADDITEATADHYNGRIVVFTSGNLAGQASDITDYEAVGGIGQFTVTAMTEAPSNNDTFVIV